MGNLINWAIVFLIIALVAGLFGFGGLAGTAMGGAKLLFWVAIILFWCRQSQGSCGDEHKVALHVPPNWAQGAAHTASPPHLLNQLALFE